MSVLKICSASSASVTTTKCIWWIREGLERQLGQHYGGKGSAERAGERAGDQFSLRFLRAPDMVSSASGRRQLLITCFEMHIACAIFVGCWKWWFPCTLNFDDRSWRWAGVRWFA